MFAPFAWIHSICTGCCLALGSGPWVGRISLSAGGRFAPTPRRLQPRPRKPKALLCWSGWPWCCFSPPSRSSLLGSMPGIGHATLLFKNTGANYSRRSPSSSVARPKNWWFRPWGISAPAWSAAAARPISAGADPRKTGHTPGSLASSAVSSIHSDLTLAQSRTLWVRFRDGTYLELKAPIPSACSAHAHEKGASHLPFLSPFPTVQHLSIAWPGILFPEL